MPHDKASKDNKVSTRDLEQIEGGKTKRERIAQKEKKVYDITAHRLSRGRGFVYNPSIHTQDYYPQSFSNIGVAGNTRACERFVRDKAVETDLLEVRDLSVC